MRAKVKAQARDLGDGGRGRKGNWGFESTSQSRRASLNEDWSASRSSLSLSLLVGSGSPCPAPSAPSSILKGAAPQDQCRRATGVEVGLGAYVMVGQTNNEG